MKQKSSKSATSLVIFSIGFIIFGIFSTIVAVNNIINYDSFYIFCTVNLLVAIFLGFLLLEKYKPFFKLNSLQEKNFYALKIYFTIGFFGVCLNLFHFINSNLVYDTVCKRHNIVDKERIDRGRKTPSSNYLFLDFNGRIKRINCNYRYWLTIQKTSRINVCEHKSYIGFDFIELPDQ